jgi:7-cyano-7-deazaguanine reductase
MASFQDKEGLLLGKNTPVVDVYSPQLLYPIPRTLARDGLGIGARLPFSGEDIWHAYELSWLDQTGKPVARVGRFSIAASSPNIVESKSFKLYLNSLNSTPFADDQEAMDVICRDIGAAAGGEVSLRLFGPADPALAGQPLPGECVDDCTASAGLEQPSAAMLIAGEAVVEEALHSHLLRSLCPVTGQPDWATLWVSYRGRALAHASVLQYVLAYRQHQEFHEQCVERIFIDLQSVLQPEYLHVQAFYTRRGGLDINPFRSTDALAKALPRMDRQ